MSYPNSVDSGGVQPLWVGSDVWPPAAGVTTTLVTNQCYLYAFELQASTTFSGGTWHNGSTATGTSDIGVYTFAGTQLAHSGATANVASTTTTANFIGGNITLAPGQYFIALCCSNNTDTYHAESGVATATPFTRLRRSTTAASAGVLPASTGGYNNGAGQGLVMALVIVGGLV